MNQVSDKVKAKKKRLDNRGSNQHRPIKVERNYTKHAAGSVLISYGDTKVICTASIEEKVPSFLRDQGQGWITAEYGMLPGATHSRVRREASRGKQTGRTNEIQRLIGRSLRAAVDLEKLGERTINLDADVIQADGGTRTAAITGCMVALSDAVQKLRSEGVLTENPIQGWLAAVSVGIVEGEVLSDLCYEEDSSAEVDMNIVMTEKGEYIEVQGTAEAGPFSTEQLTEMLAIAKDSIKDIIRIVKP